MKILFTGASSFTGYWFVKELVAAGHDVVMTFTRELDEYVGIRRQRVDALRQLGQPIASSCRFGDEQFGALIDRELQWDLLCHHAADATNYKSVDFDVVAAVQNNAYNVRDTLSRLLNKGCSKVLLTGSVFEGGEGAGSEGLPAFSAYGLSKELTARTFQFFADTNGVHFAKFVIPNPFGPYEEPRFTAYLMRSWFAGKTPQVNTPAYVRDNIHVSLLAKAYADFAAHLPSEPGHSKLNPSGYIESQGIFAERFAREMRVRLKRPCEVELTRQTEFTEPRIRVNTDAPDSERLGWDETQAWARVAEFYQRNVG